LNELPVHATEIRSGRMLAIVEWIEIEDKDAPRSSHPSAW